MKIEIWSLSLKFFLSKYLPAQSPVMETLERGVKYIQT